ncbi:AraC family transcriptional regulator [Ruminococcaceae bacterium OttesenSCG-928-D13]|nr:AraC family transcriptional regulator [Ruminococcaceae bacterium OttesenSCG-928-D13]
MSNIRFDNEEHLFQEEPLRLLYIATSRYEGDWHSFMHAHQCTELFYVISGKGAFLVEELNFPVEPNNIVIINPNVQHTETAVRNNPMEYIVLGMEGGEFLLKESDDKRFCIFDCGDSGTEILGMLNEMQDELQSKQQYHGIVARNLLENLSVKLLRYRSVSLQRQAPAKKASRECAQVKHYIDNHFKENITLDLLSELAHVNKYYLVHSFAREMGVSPINYLIQKRIQESRYMLQNTGYSISEISQILGFSSPSYFSQSFSRINKMSPREFRLKASLQNQAQGED